ncbi:MAG: hypothetical protein NT027_07175 [Proteobacteria bacterium]|nr:hypothetical protein [Pseudomonadota bacterium]
MKTLFLYLTLFSLVSCKSRPTQQQGASSLRGNVIERDRPGLAMYHYGSKEILQSNDGKARFSDEAWAKIGSRHPEFRKGLYIAQHPGHNERYAEELLGKANDQFPWFMKVTLDAQCLNEGRIAPYLSDLITDEQFQIWYRATIDRARTDVEFKATLPKEFPASFQTFRKNCLFGSDGQRLDPVSQSKEIVEKFKMIAQDGSTTACSRVMERYFKQPILNDADSSIYIVRDSYWPQRGFWYIRDQRCISTMDASSLNIIRTLSSVPEVWSTSPFTNDVERNIETTRVRSGIIQFSILMRALLDLNFNVDDADVAALAKNAESGTMEWSHRPVYSYIRRYLETIKRCGRNLEDLKDLSVKFLESVKTSTDNLESQVDELFGKYIVTCGGRVISFAKSGRYRAAGSTSDTDAMCDQVLTYDDEAKSSLTIQFSCTDPALDQKKQFQISNGTAEGFKRYTDSERYIYMMFEDSYMYYRGTSNESSKALMMRVGD